VAISRLTGYSLQKQPNILQNKKKLTKTHIMSTKLPTPGQQITDGKNWGEIINSILTNVTTAKQGAGSVTGIPGLYSGIIEARSLTEAAIKLNGGSGAIIMDDSAHKRISWNDGGGGFNLRSGNYIKSITVNGATGVQTTYAKGTADVKGGASYISLASDASDGIVTLYVAPIGDPDTAVTWTNSLILDKDRIRTTKEFWTGDRLNVGTLANGGFDTAGITVHGMADNPNFSQEFGGIAIHTGGKSAWGFRGTTKEENSGHLNVINASTVGGNLKTGTIVATFSAANNLGLGTTTPKERLEVNGTIKLSNISPHTADGNIAANRYNPNSLGIVGVGTKADGTDRKIFLYGYTSIDSGLSVAGNITGPTITDIYNKIAAGSPNTVVGDHLGNHTAIMALNMNGQAINNAGVITGTKIKAVGNLEQGGGYVTSTNPHWAFQKPLGTTPGFDRYYFRRSTNADGTGDQVDLMTIVDDGTVSITNSLNIGNLKGTGDRFAMANAQGAIVPGTTIADLINQVKTQIPAATGGDNLGNHTATTDLNMNGKNIAGIGGYITSTNPHWAFQKPLGTVAGFDRYYFRRSTNADGTGDQVDLMTIVDDGTVSITNSLNIGNLKNTAPNEDMLVVAKKDGTLRPINQTFTELVNSITNATNTAGAASGKADNAIAKADSALAKIAALPAATGGDNLGNHTATQPLNMSGQPINGVGNITITPLASAGFQIPAVNPNGTLVAGGISWGTFPSADHWDGKYSYNFVGPWDAGDGAVLVHRAQKADQANSLSAAGIAGIRNSFTKINAQGTGNVDSIPKAATNNSQAALELIAPAGSAAYIAFHKPGSYGANFGLDGDNNFAFGGWSAGDTYSNIKAAYLFSSPLVGNGDRFAMANAQGAIVPGSSVTDLINQVKASIPTPPTQDLSGIRNDITGLKAADVQFNTWFNSLESLWSFKSGSNGGNASTGLAITTSRSIFAGLGIRAAGDLSCGGTLTVDSGNAFKAGGGSWGSTSDARTKDIRNDYARGLAEVSKIRTVQYNYKKDNKYGFDSTKEYVGVIAQEVKELIPEAVTEGSDGYFSVNNDPIIMAMVNAIKELKAQVDSLKAEVASLKK
jgi:Chaperone of endosialidase